MLRFQRVKKEIKIQILKKKYKKTPQQIEKCRLAMINSSKFQASRKSKEYREKISNLQSDPILLLNENLEDIEEFSTATRCAEKYGYTRGNIKNACRELRPIGVRKAKGLHTKHWVIRKRLKEESILKIKHKLNSGQTI